MILETTVNTNVLLNKKTADLKQTFIYAFIS